MVDGGDVANLHETFLKNEALFSDTKIVTSVYSQSLKVLDVEMIKKIKMDGVPGKKFLF
jgi:hypothetical protein